MLIEDGTGSGSKLGVKKGEVLVTTMSAIQKATLRGDAYAWNAVSYDITAADTILTVRNTSQDRLLVINRLYMWTDVPGSYDIHIQTIATAFSTSNGAVVTGVNLNTSSAKVADAGAISDEEAITSQGSIILTLMSNEATADQFAINFPTNDAIVLGTNGRIAIDAAAASAACEATIIGYFIDA